MTERKKPSRWIFVALILGRAVIPLVALGAIAAGVVARWGWPAAAIVVGGLLWIDLSLPSARPRAARSTTDAGT